MTFKTILVPFTGDPGSDGALDSALKMGDAFDAYIELLHVLADPVVALAGMSEGIAGITAGQVIEAAQAAAETKAMEARKLAEQSCRAAGWTLVEQGEDSKSNRTAVWRELISRENEEIARFGRVADLIVVATPEQDEGSAISGRIAASLFDTRRPVMVAPETAPECIGRKVAIAWNGSREASAAVAAALPFITGADKVTVIQDAANGADEAGGLVAYLARHGVAADRVGVPADKRELGERLVYAAVTAGADLLIMGAYGHSRFRELILGGATLGALKHTTIPLFMVH